MMMYMKIIITEAGIQIYTWGGDHPITLGTIHGIMAGTDGVVLGTIADGMTHGIMVVGIVLGITTAGIHHGIMADFMIPGFTVDIGVVDIVMDFMTDITAA